MSIFPQSMKEAMFKAAYQPEPTPFFKPDFTNTIPKWDHEIADLDSNWLITYVPDSHKAMHPKDIIADPSIAGVFFTPKVWNELSYAVEYLADRTGECAMFAAVRPLSSNSELYNRKPHYLVYDWFLPLQTASSGEVRLDAKDCQKYFDYLEKHHPQEFGNGLLHTNLMHVHSHHRMALCNWSRTDLHQQNRRDELGWAGIYKLFFLFTIGHGVKATQVTYYPTLARNDCFVGLCYSEPEYIIPLTKQRKKELNDRMDKLVKKSSGGHPRGAGDDFTRYLMHDVPPTHIILPKQTTPKPPVVVDNSVRSATPESEKAYEFAHTLCEHLEDFFDNTIKDMHQFGAIVNWLEGCVYLAPFTPEETPPHVLEILETVSRSLEEYICATYVADNTPAPSPAERLDLGERASKIFSDFLYDSSSLLAEGDGSDEDQEDSDDPDDPYASFIYEQKKEYELYSYYSELVEIVDSYIPIDRLVHSLMEEVLC